METFAQRLRRLRMAHGLSVRRLEDLIEVEHGVISRLETGHRAYPSVRTALKLARMLGCSLDYLFGEEAAP